MSTDQIRLDKFLWVVRLFKTRSQAAEDCKKGRVLVNGMPVKSSRLIKIGDEISIKETPVYRMFRVIGISDKRMAAKLTPAFIIDITPADQLELLELNRLVNKLNRHRGLGRPTKRDRRDLDNFMEGSEE